MRDRLRDRLRDALSSASETRRSGLGAFAAGALAAAATIDELDVKRQRGRYSLEAEATLAATPESIFAVITDFDDNAYSRISRGYKESRYLEPSADGTPMVYTRLEGCALWHCMSLERTERLETDAPRWIKSTTLPEGSNFKYSTSEWMLRARRREHQDDVQARDGARLRRAAGHRTVVLEAHVVARRVARRRAYRAARARARRPARRTAAGACIALDDDLRGAPARMVRRPRPPRPAVAIEAHAVLGVGVGDHAAADAGRHRDPVLRASSCSAFRL